MNRSLAYAIIRALAVSGPTEERLSRLKRFNDRDWRRTFAWLDDSGLALELLDTVERAGAPDVLPRWVAQDLARRRAGNRHRLRQMKQEFDGLNRAFDRAGVDYAVLKGFSLVPAYTPDPALRSQYDYDYLVHPQSFHVARQVLESAGLYEKSQSAGLDPQGATLFVGEPLDYSVSAEDWYSAGLPRKVELHLSLWEYERDAICVDEPQDVLQWTRQARWEGLSFPVLADDDVLIFQCLHAFHHILDCWCRPSCFLEIARCMVRRETDRRFWAAVESRIDGGKCLSDILRFVFRLAADLFGAPIPARSSLAGASRRSRAIDLWVQRYGIGWCLARFPGSKLSLLVHREFVEEPAAWSEVCRGRLLPFHRPASVAEPREPNLKSNWTAKWRQGRFVMARARYHIAGLAIYSWHISGWKRTLGALARAKKEPDSPAASRQWAAHSPKNPRDFPSPAADSRLPTADCLLPTEKETAR
jgi:hypothetical protein